MKWNNVLELDANRKVAGGSYDALRQQIASGADLRIYTAFRHNEHLDTASDNAEVVDEVSEFRTTYLVEERWAAGIMTTRMPINPPEGFGPRPSMSFFLYNEDGSQAIARPYFDGLPTTMEPCEHPAKIHGDMPKYRETSRWDDRTNAPSSNFIYEFDRFRFFTNSSWQEVLSHDGHGNVHRGSLAALTDAFNSGCAMKVGLSGLCDSLGEQSVAHVVFIDCGPGYFHRDRRIFSAGTHPTVRVRPGIPMTYRSEGWDFGSLFVRTDGLVEYWRCDPYSLTFQKIDLRLPVRWFVR